MRRILLLLLLVMAVVDGVSGQEEPDRITPIQVPHSIGVIAWSPDGTQIAVGGGNYPCDRFDAKESSEAFHIQLFDVQTTTLVQTLTGLRCPVEDIAWTLDEKKLAAANYESIGVTVWDTESGEVILSDPTGAQGVASVDWSPTADRLAIGYAANYVSVIDSNSSDVLTMLSVGGTTVDWSGNADFLAVSSYYHSSVYIVDLAGQTEVIKFTTGEEPNVDVKWSPDAKKIAAASRDSSIRIWDVASRESLFSFVDFSDFVYAIDWHPDGTMLASASEDGTVRIWHAETGDLLEIFTYTGPVYALDWSPDGTQIAFGGADTTGNPPQVMIVDAPQLPQITPTPTP